ncbi:hypothetical protein M440DRAFT_1249378 [Trichoderma longibrachiatum ATCC 18648]|uniref:Uncharacterized protein n=1 Tax=Trichoderma longibrachiatum ATCC 18648 TaxID=983965 RepID=A0A2T4C3Z1_TRILO|nr:hypothetical protein M440DRAFT_1249378 [Trichoderma longibrachiatum ATCC 18648]
MARMRWKPLIMIGCALAQTGRRQDRARGKRQTRSSDYRDQSSFLCNSCILPAFPSYSSSNPPPPGSTYLDPTLSISPTAVFSSPLPYSALLLVLHPR